MTDDPNRPSRRWLIAVIGVWLALLLILPSPYNGLMLLATILSGIAFLVGKFLYKHKQRIFAILRFITRALYKVLRLAWRYVLPPDADLPTLKVIPARIDYPPVILGLVVLVGLAEINGNLLHLPVLQQVSSHVQFVMLCAGIGLVAWGLAGINLSNPSIRARRALPLQSHPVILITLITLLAFALRLWQLEDSLQTWVDEVNFADQVMRFTYEPHTPILARSDPTMSFPRLYVYGQYLSVNLLGHTLAGLRLASVFVGTLTIPAVYVLGRRLFDRRTALVASLLLATFPPHLQFSRLGLNNVADPLVGTLLLAALVKWTPHNMNRIFRRGRPMCRPMSGAHTGAPLQSSYLRGIPPHRAGERHITRADLVLVGVLLGLTQYFYEAGRYVFPALALLWLGNLWLRGRMQGRDLRLLLLMTVIVAAPVYYAIFAAHLPITSRLNHTSSVELPYLPRFVMAFAVYVSQPDMRLYIYYYGGQTALILPAFVPLLLGGVAYALRWMRRWPGMMLLLVWLLVTSLGNSILIEPGVYARYVVTFPALVLLLAVGLCYALPGVMGWFFNMVRRGDLLGRPYKGQSDKGVQLYAPTTVIIVLTLIIAASQTVYYFGVHLPGYMQQIWREYYDYDIDDAMLRAAELPDGTQVYFINRFPPDEGTLGLQLKFLNDRLTVYSIPRDSADEFLSRLEEWPLAFFVAPYDMPTLTLLRKYYRLKGPYFSPHVPITRQFYMFIPQP